MLQAFIAYFLRLGPQCLNFLNKWSERTIAPSVEARGVRPRADVAAHLGSSTKFRPFTSRASWRAPFSDQGVYAGHILSSISGGLACGRFLSCMLARSHGQGRSTRGALLSSAEENSIEMNVYNVNTKGEEQANWRKVARTFRVCRSAARWHLLHMTSDSGRLNSTRWKPSRWE